jgi:N6-L-threonylcarbamoyladenine synthase
MYLLAFESSCDDTSVALLRDDALVSMHTHTQLEHIQTLGVVPEVAARLHADHIFDLITRVLTDGGIELDAVDVFAATTEPGLVPSLLIGKTVAKSLAISHKKPIIWVNHIEGHIFSLLLERKLEELEFPMIVLSASGGHNDLFFWEWPGTFPSAVQKRNNSSENRAPEWAVLWVQWVRREDLNLKNEFFDNSIEKVGSTIDDSAGESMDKVGRSLWLPFPAGRYIDELAQKYDPAIHKNIPSFPLVLPEWNLNFSFSGLKSAALREIDLRIKKTCPLKKGEEWVNLTLSNEGWKSKWRGQGGFLSETDLIEISYGYQGIITNILSKRLIEAQKKTGAKSIGLVGGVSANSALRQIMEEYSRENSIPYYTPKSLKYCGDNATMIGMRAYWETKKSS